MRLLVTGTEGQLARALSERGATAAGVEVVCVGRPSLDLARPETIAAAVREVGPDVIVNAAAYTAVDRAEDEPEIARAVNAVAPGVLADASRKAGARLIHLSSDYVYDGEKSEPYVESDQLHPLSVYGQTKLDGETAVREHCNEHVILRTSWVYSPFGRNFVRSMLELAATRSRLTVVDDQYGNPTSALDVADAVLAIVSHWRQTPRSGLGQVYHCAGTGATTWCGLARHVLRESARLGGPLAEVVAITSRDWPTKAARPANSRLDCGRLARDFAWRSPEWQQSVSVVVRRLLSIPATGAAS
jgi:dTDP-4-dehydrorhamnose reductase